jgi:ubiquinone/menaquinone biosynthesis C-methylase UbiE
MPERYDHDAAFHYAAYRPPLHESILEKALPEGSTFETAVDVGSGAGASAIALAGKCKRVIAIEPSEAMVSAARQDPRVTWVRAVAECLPIADRSIGLVTFAGSLFYTDRQKVGSEIARICTTGGLVVVYDFEIRLQDVLRRLDYPQQTSGSTYNHALNFAGLSGFDDRRAHKERVTLHLTRDKLMHVVLSDSNVLDWVRSRSVNVAEVLSDSEVTADLYYTVYTEL